MSERVEALPAKEFFISMITKDIALDSCILDLVDNSIDGAKRKIETSSAGSQETEAYQGFRIDITFDKTEFKIEDNGSGISVEAAKEYAFRFGRRRDTKKGPRDSIGIYGIGMKRAMFKLGQCIEVDSSTDQESFVVQINVREWEKADAWDFALEKSGPRSSTGTTVRVTQIHPPVAADFSDVSFANHLCRIISRDYSFFLQKGLTVTVNKQPIPALPFSLRYGGEFEPAHIKYSESLDDTEVRVEITAGMAAPPPDPDEDLAQLNIPDIDRYGWFVLCNDRVVLAGDKSERTVWGSDRFPRWHGQYNGFLGIVSFHSNDPSVLPWTTTKRDIDETDRIYRAAVVRMKDLTKPFIEYTHARKANPDEARDLERQTEARELKPANPMNEREAMKLPQIARPKVVMRNVLYRKPEEELKEAARALGDPGMSFKDIGEGTFEYFYDNEVEG